MNAVRPELFEPVVHGFYEAAVVPDQWTGALHLLAMACGATGVAAHSSNGSATFATVFSEGAAGLYDDFMKRWKEPELNSHRSRGVSLIRSGWSGALTERDCFSSEELAQDPFHQEFIVPAGFSSFAGLVLGQGRGVMLSASIYRRPKEGAYEAGEIELINKLATRLRSIGDFALHIALRSQNTMVDALGLSGKPVALIGFDGVVTYTNSSFEHLLGDGVDIVEGHIRSWDAEGDRMIASSIARASGDFSAGDEPLAPVILPRSNGRRPLVAQVMPVVGAAHDLLHLSAAVVTLTDLDEPTQAPAEDLLARFFGFSPVEARLAAQIAAGRTLPEISKADRTPHETLRTRLKAVFQRTGTSRQVELALLLANFAGSGAARPRRNMAKSIR
jgi:hypothetical protein